MTVFFESLKSNWLVAFYIGIIVGYCIKKFVFADVKEIHPFRKILEHFEASRKTNIAERAEREKRARIRKIKDRLLYVSKEWNRLNEELSWYNDSKIKNRLTNHGLDCYLEKKGAFGSVSEEKRILEQELKELCENIS